MIFSNCISLALNFSTLVSSNYHLVGSGKPTEAERDDELEQFRSLKKYLVYNKIDPDLLHRITRFLRHSLDQERKAMLKDDAQIPMLTMLSKSLQVELQLQKNAECLKDSKFLYSLLQTEDYYSDKLLGDLVTQGMQHMVLARDDMVFSASRVASMSYLLHRGGQLLRTHRGLWGAL